jgi:hypothetical protein
MARKTPSKHKTMPNNILKAYGVCFDLRLAEEMHLESDVDMPQMLLHHNQKVRGCELWCMCEGCEKDKQDVASWYDSEGKIKEFNCFRWLNHRRA